MIRAIIQIYIIFKMDIQGHKDIYDQTAGYIAARQKDPKSVPLLDHRDVDQLCTPLHEGLKDCALHHSQWPFSEDMSHHQQCNRLLDIMDNPAITTSTVNSLITTPSPGRIHKDENLSTVVVTSTTPAVASDEMDLNICSHDHIMTEWLRMYGLCIIIGWCLGILCYTVFWRGTEMLRNLVNKIQIRAGMIQAHKSSHAFSYVSSLPVSTKLDNRLNWSQPNVDSLSEVGSILDLTTSMTV